MLGNRAADYGRQDAMGSLAIVVGSTSEHDSAEMFSQADAGRPIRLFTDMALARAWLAAPAAGT